MTPFHKGLLAIFGCAGVMAVLAIPLLLRRVPRNHLYGFRTRRTLSDDAVWYAVNAHFGRGLLVASLVTAAAVAALTAADVTPETFLNLSLVVLVAPLAVAMAATFQFLHTLSKKGDRLP